MTAVVVIGPNLTDQSKGSFHVHTPSCSAVNSRKYASREHEFDRKNVLNFQSQEEMVEYVYADMLDENEVHNLISDFYIHTCIESFPMSTAEKETPTMTITFELFNDDMFLIMEIASVDVESDLALLRSIPNVRNIRVEK